MQARYYDPNIGRFLSIDPVNISDNGNPIYFNRYAYVGNDPVNAIDPDGREGCIMDNCWNDMKEALSHPAATATTEALYDFFVSDAVNAAVSASKGDFKEAGIAATMAFVKPAKVMDKIGDVTKALSKQGYTKVEIDGDTFVQKTFETSSGDIDFAAKVGGDSKSLKLDEMQIFPTSGQAPGLPALRDLDRAITSDLKSAGFIDVTASGTRLSGAKKGQVVTIRRDIE